MVCACAEARAGVLTRRRRVDAADDRQRQAGRGTGAPAHCPGRSLSDVLKCWLPLGNATTWLFARSVAESSLSAQVKRGPNHDPAPTVTNAALPGGRTNS